MVERAAPSHDAGMHDPTISASDAEAVRALRYAFGRALDTRDWALFASLFADRVDADFAAWGIPARAMTPDELVALFRPAFATPATRTLQAYSNLELRPDGADAITMTSALVGLHHRDGADGGADFELVARYHDRAVRVADGWRLAAVRLEVIFTRGNPALLG